jgi:hypothetical protein
MSLAFELCSITTNFIVWFAAAVEPCGAGEIAHAGSALSGLPFRR